MVTVRPSGSSDTWDTRPTFTPDRSTLAPEPMPATLFDLSRRVKVVPWNIVPLLNNSTSTASNTRPRNTNRPTLVCSRISLISKVDFFRVRHAVNELFHHRVLRLKNLLRGPAGVNLFVMEQQN